jgi:hypothetical protein
MASDYCSKINDTHLDKAWNHFTQYQFGSAMIEVGEAIQDGNDSHSGNKVSFALGGFVQVLTNITEGAYEVVKNSAVAVGYGLKNLGSYALQVAHTGTLKLSSSIQLTPREFELNNPISFNSATPEEFMHSEKIANDATYPSYGLQAEQSPLPIELQPKVASLVQMMRCSQSTTKIDIPTGYRKAVVSDDPKESEIPHSMLARRQDRPFTGSAMALHIEDESAHKVVLRSDPLLSALHVGVFIKEEQTSNNSIVKKVVLCFDGTTASRPGTFMSDIFTLIGGKPSAFREADELVRIFINKYGPENVTVTGDSLGGSLAEYAARNNSTKDHIVEAVVTNSFGISPGLHYELDEKMNFDNVMHVNSLGDFVSQTLTSITPMTQYGVRYALPGSENVGHSLKDTNKIMNPGLTNH